MRGFIFSNSRKYFRVILLLIFNFGSILIAQEFNPNFESSSSYFQVDSIKISGNEHTEEFVILRELSFELGDSVNGEILHYNRERIFSLGIFTKVNVVIENYDGKNIVFIRVEESWYIFPVPFVNVREKTFERASYGVSLKYKNFRGRNETIRATVSLGYDPFYSLEYENPLVIQSFDISLSLSFGLGKSVNKSEILEIANGNSFDFKTMALNSIWGKRITEESSLFFIVGYSKIKVPTENINLLMASGTSSDNKITTGVSYLYDSRNLKQYASDGEYLGISYLYNGFGNSQSSYNVLNIDVRDYTEIYKKFILRGRISARHTFGEFIPIYDYSMFGYDYFVRGNRFEIDEGNNRILTNLEVSYPILPEWNFALDLPILPNSLTRSRISIMASLFADAGTVFNNDEKINFADFDHGYGFGLTFLFLPYSSFSLEYAFNEFGKGEILLGTEVSFWYWTLLYIESWK